MVKLKIYFSFLLSILFGVQYPEFSINVNNNPYPADLFLHNTSPNQTQFIIFIEKCFDYQLSIKYLLSIHRILLDFQISIK